MESAHIAACELDTEAPKITFAAPACVQNTGNQTRRAWILEKLSRVTSAGSFIPEIDGLRCVAILSVLFLHIKGFTVAYLPSAEGQAVRESPVGRLLSHGGLGVPLFFVISGFILSMPFARAHLLGGAQLPLAKYFGRRLTRLEPPYVIHILLLLLLTVTASQFGLVRSALGDVTQSGWESLLAHAAASLTYSHNQIYGDGNGVLWSLEIEVQFYIVCPLLAMLFFGRRDNKTRRLQLLAVLILFSVVAHLIRSAELRRLELSLVGQAQFFLAGFLLADVYLIDWQEKPQQCRSWDFVGLTGWCLLPLFNSVDILRIGTPLIMLIIYMSVFRGRILNRLFRNPWMVVVGGMCYTIYMYHYVIVSVVGRYTINYSLGLAPWVAVTLQLALVGFVVVLVSSVLFFYFEKTFMYRDWHIRAWAFATRFRRRGSLGEGGCSAVIRRGPPEA